MKLQAFYEKFLLNLDVFRTKKVKSILKCELSAKFQKSQSMIYATKAKNKIQNDTDFSKMRDTVLLVLDYLFSQPISGIAEISEKSEKAYNTISNTLKHFTKLALVSENIINKRNKVYRFEPCLALREKEYIVKFQHAAR